MAKHHSTEIGLLIEKARTGLPKTHHDKPAKLTDEIMRYYREEFRNLPSDFFRWCYEGLYQRLCARFKGHGTEGEKSRQAIFDQWVDPIAREHVLRFGDPCFYDPALKRYVDLIPKRSIAQMRGGAEHKRKFGNETLEQARALDDLADYLERMERLH